ncbi:MAG: hypothetical protein NC930_01375 [Candidatus Omnitrophica bacterium]|nr:hypothetical protein [Candidatus Omnitrophota bacterium]
MDISMIRGFLGWCAVLNVGLLLFWFAVITFARDWVYRIHSRGFKLSVEQFQAIHYAGMAYFKMTVFIFNVVPWFALRIVG